MWQGGVHTSVESGPLRRFVTASVAFCSSDPLHLCFLRAWFLSLGAPENFPEAFVGTCQCFHSVAYGAKLLRGHLLVVLSQKLCDVNLL